MPIYENSKIATNHHNLYEEIFEKRGVESIRQYKSMPFTGIDFDTLMVQEYTWTVKDSLHKLSHFFYQTYEYWWIIGFVNQKPTDAHYNIGDTIYIPSNPREIAKKIGG